MKTHPAVVYRTSAEGVRIFQGSKTTSFQWCPDLSGLGNHTGLERMIESGRKLTVYSGLNAVCQLLWFAGRGRRSSVGCG